MARSGDAAGAVAPLTAGVKRPHYTATELLGCGTFGRVYSAQEQLTVETALAGAGSNPFKQLVVKEALLASEYMLQENPTYGRLRHTGASAVGVAGGTARLGGAIVHNRELTMSEALSTKVDPLTPVRICEDGTVTVGGSDDGSSAGGSGDGGKWSKSPALPLIPQFLDGFFSFDAGTRDWQNITNCDASGDVCAFVVSEAFGTNLYRFVQRNPQKFAHPVFARDVCRQLVVLFAELHSRGIAHRDFKPHNALVTVASTGRPEVRLCDMGSAKHLRPVARSDGTRHFPGTPRAAANATPFITSRYYRPPELLCGSSQYGPPVDMWALGVTLAELYMLTASLTSPSLARSISLSRGDGKKPAKKKAAAAAGGEAAGAEEGAADGDDGDDGDDDVTDIAGGDDATGGGDAMATLPPGGDGASGVVKRTSDDFGPQPTTSRDEVRRRSHCTLFHGASSDAAQLLQIINVLGTPSSADVAALRLATRCNCALLKLLQLVTAQAARSTGNTTASAAVAAVVAAEAAAAVSTTTAAASTAADATAITGDIATDAAMRSTSAPPPPPPPLPLTTPTTSWLDVAAIPPLPLVPFLTARGAPEPMAHLIAAMLRWDPRARITAVEALAHPALADAVYLPRSVRARLVAHVAASGR